MTSSTLVSSPSTKFYLFSLAEVTDRKQACSFGTFAKKEFHFWNSSRTPQPFRTPNFRTPSLPAFDVKNDLLK